MRESTEDDSGMITKLEEELRAMRFVLRNSLEQIDKMYTEIDELKEENLMLLYSAMHNAVISNEIRGMLEGKD